MSIFKETFRDFVFNQLKIRETIFDVGRGNIPELGNRLSGVAKTTLKDDTSVTLPPGAFYTNTTSRQCTIRMSSGADLKKDNTLLDEHDKDFRPKDMHNEGLAIRYMLEGGIPAKDIDFINNRGNDKGTSENPIKVIPRGRGTRQFPRGTKDYGSAYGDPYIRSNAKDGFGIVPMPGIIDAEIRTKTAYGSLRDAKVNFTCHNRRQLDILETLYMRPGMPILLEWGWNPYISNDGKRENYFPYLWEWFNQNSSINDINKIIHQRIELSGGNYDGFVGYIKNFEITSRPDGGYDCTTELAAMGEVLEGLKGKSSGFTLHLPVQLAGIQTDSEENIEVDNLEYYLNALIGYCEASNASRDDRYADRSNVRYGASFFGKNKIKYLGAIVRDIVPLINSDYKTNVSEEQIKDFQENIMQKSLNDFAKLFSNKELDKVREYLGDPYYGRYILFKGETVASFDDSNNTKSTEHYIKWELLALILNNLVFNTYQEGSKVSPLTEITWRDEAPNTKLKSYLKYSKYDFKNFDNNEISFFVDNSKVTTPLSDIMDMSIDPSVCLLPHQLDNINNSTINDQEYNTIENTTDNRSISDIYINLEYLLKLYKKTRYKGDEINEDFNLFTFLQTIWEKDINNACANTHEFTIHTEKTNSNLIRIIDMQQNVKIKPKDLYEFKIQGNESIVRDFNYNTTIDSKLSATISIASQAPNSISNLDAVSFAAFNKNIKYRFFKEPVEETSTTIKRKGEQYTKDIETLKTMLSFLYEYKVSILKGDFKNEGNSNLQVSTAKRYIQNIESKIISLKSRYSKTDEANNIYRGYRKRTRSNISKSTVIPLKFNCKIDGIGGLVIGNVFKINKNFLPKGYDGEDIAFAIMSENQKITAGQDWTTEFSGQLILLDLDKFNGEEWDDILWDDTANTAGEKDRQQGAIIISANRDDKNITRQQQIPDPNVTSIPENGDIFLKVSRAKVRDEAEINNMGSNPIDFNNNIIGYITGNQGMKLGTVVKQIREDERTDIIEITSGDGGIILTESDKATLGWGTDVKEGVNYELVDDNIDIGINGITSYNGKWYIPEGIRWKFEKKGVQWNWFLIEFLSGEPRKFGFEGDEAIISGTGGWGDGDEWIDGNKGWMREDTLCTENYTTPQ
tara:strand:+ start:256 stop:3666 length:3411 start_codon:yes stop_codon:yes gene_type:complete